MPHARTPIDPGTNPTRTWPVSRLKVGACATQDVFEFTNGILGQIEGVPGWTASAQLLAVRRGFVGTPWWRASLAARSPAPAAPVAAVPA